MQGTDVVLTPDMGNTLWNYLNPTEGVFALQVPSWFIAKYPQFFEAEPESKLEEGWYIVQDNNLMSCKYYCDGSWYYDLFNGEPRDKSTANWTVVRKL